MPSPTRHGPLAAAVGAVFGLIARLRGARALHPRGEGYEAELVLDPDSPSRCSAPSRMPTGPVMGLRDAAQRASQPARLARPAG